MLSSGLRVAAALLILALTACQTPRNPIGVASTTDAALDDRTLTLIVSELQMYLHDDTYRIGRTVIGGGSHVFAMALKRLNRLRSLRSEREMEWENIDVVIEYARARSLERLRRYSQAAAAYKQVLNTGSALAESAEEASAVMRRFASLTTVPTEPFATPGEELVFLDQRVKQWRELAWSHRGDLFESLAREEAEAWEMLRVDWLARNRGSSQAIEACRRLVEHHSESKLRPRHLIRLGDLYAAAVQHMGLQARARIAAFDGEHYEALLDQGFAAYELAGEARRPELRREAQTRIDALLAYHEGTLQHAR